MRRNVLIILCSIILLPLFAVIASAAPTLTTPSTTNVGANMATMVLKSSGTGTGYFTLLSGSNANCGTGTQVKAGQTSAGATAPYHGSLPLTANVAGNYTVRNLPQSTAYTACFTADSPTGSNLNATPVKVNLTTTAAATYNYPDWSPVGDDGIANSGAYTTLAFAPDGIPYLAYQDSNNSLKIDALAKIVTPLEIRSRQFDSCRGGMFQKVLADSPISVGCVL